MKLGPKSRDLLELLSILGLETMEAALHLPLLYKAGSSSSERSFHRRAQSLHDKGWIVWNDNSIDGKWMAKLTEQGKAKLYSGIDPQRFWNESWNGKWRLLSFDLPQFATRERQALRVWLKAHRFGLLQGSVWIPPRELGSWTLELARLKVDPSSVVSMLGGFQGADSDAHYARRAWDLDNINLNYRRHVDFLSTSGRPSLESFAAWFKQESTLWRAAFEADPFLPKPLWPKGFASKYLGPDAYQARTDAYRQLADALR